MDIEKHKLKSLTVEEIQLIIELSKGIHPEIWKDALIRDELDWNNTANITIHSFYFYYKDRIIIKDIIDYGDSREEEKYSMLSMGGKIVFLQNLNKEENEKVKKIKLSKKLNNF